MSAISHCKFPREDHVLDETDVSQSNHVPHTIAQVIAISSGKGGVGKSSLTTNLGIALAKSGKKVCLFDADTNLANINILLGITPLHTLEHFLNHNTALKEVIIKGPEGMDIIAGASGIASFVHLSHFQRDKLLTGIRSLERSYQYLLIDTAAGIDQTNLTILLSVPYLILSITHEPTSLTDAFSLLRVLRKHNFNRSVLIIVNMASSHQSAMTTFKRFKETVNKYLHFKVFFAGHVLSDKSMPEAILHQQPVLLRKPTAPASKCIFQISERLLNAFNNRSVNGHSMSENLAKIILAEDQKNSIEQSNIEHYDFIPAPKDAPSAENRKPVETIPSAPMHPVTGPENRSQKSSREDAHKSALLQASYYARLMAQKKTG
jgi:MinD-like ATPase involved in chromosome partitioning or flagellar assembly